MPHTAPHRLLLLHYSTLPSRHLPHRLAPQVLHRVEGLVDRVHRRKPNSSRCPAIGKESINSTGRGAAIAAPPVYKQMTKSRLDRGEGGHHRAVCRGGQILAEKRKLRDTKRAGPPLGPTVELEGHLWCI